MEKVKNNHQSAQKTVMEEMITYFQHNTGGETAESAAKFLRAANWNLEEALQLFHRNQEESEEDDYSDTDYDHSECDNLYPPPIALIHKGSFENTKLDAKAADRWLIVNIQSKAEFGSQLLNGHTWANETLAETISSNFVFWQIYDDKEEGLKVSTYYKAESRPVTLVIDPITGLQMRSWRGMMEAETLLEDLMPFMDKSPQHTTSSQYKAKILHIHRRH
ncbi:hypothetical protein LguiA_033488 [Lonicera macranthoides]